MSLTLWCGQHLLGEIHLRTPLAAGMLDGLLLPVAGHPRLTSIWQVRVPPPFGNAVIEHALEPDVAAEHGQRELRRNPGPVALTPVGPDEPAGVSPDQQLEVRDAAGAALPVMQIMLQEHRLDPAVPSPELDALPMRALAGGSVWLVFAKVAVDTPAT